MPGHRPLLLTPALTSLTSARSRGQRLAAAGLVLAAALGAAGCSGGDASGVDHRSSVGAFCTALAAFRDDVGAADSADLAAYVVTLKQAADDVESVGVPGDMPQEAEQGFALTIRRIQGLPDAATQDEVARLGDVGEEDQARLDALEAYITRACPALTEASASASGSPSGP